MTALLDKAFKAAAKLTEPEQDALAARILEEVEAEQRGQSADGNAAPTLESFLSEAREEYRRGETMEYHPAPALADPSDIWAAYDPALVRDALLVSAGALRGIDRDNLLADLEAQGHQEINGLPANS